MSEMLPAGYLALPSVWGNTEYHSCSRQPWGAPVIILFRVACIVTFFALLYGIRQVYGVALADYGTPGLAVTIVAVVGILLLLNRLLPDGSHPER
jgi:hypothetical protein